MIDAMIEGRTQTRDSRISQTVEISPQRLERDAFKTAWLHHNHTDTDDAFRNVVDHQEFTLVRAFKPGYVITNTYDASTPQCNSSNNVAMVFYYYQQQSSMEMVQQGYIYP